MQFDAFDSSFFDQPVTFRLANLVDGEHGAPTEAAPVTTATLQAFVEPDTDRSQRHDGVQARGHGAPVSRKRWRIFTATSPAAAVGTVGGIGLGLDDTATALGMTLRLLKEPYDASQGCGVLWCTECEEYGTPDA